MRKRGEARCSEKRKILSAVSIAALIVQAGSAAFGQTHTMPGSNVVPSGASLTISSGATITAAVGSTVTGFGGVGGAATWGTITGTLSAQTDLQTALNAKATSATTLAGYGITDAQPLDTDLTGWAAKTPYVGSLTITTGKTFNVTNTLTLSGTDSSTLAIGGGGTLGTAAYTAATAYQTADSDLTTWAGITPGTGVGTFLGTPSSANLRGALTDENGTGVALFNGASGTITLGEVDFTTATDAIALRNSAANHMTIFRVMPRGTNDAYFQFFGTDYLADSTNYGSFTFKASTGGHTIMTGGSGSVARSSLMLSADSTTTQLYLGTTGGVNIGTAADPGAGILNVTTGFRLGNAAASGKIPMGNGTNYVASTPTFPTAAGAVGYTIRSDATNFASYPQQLINSSVTAQSPSTSDVYLAGSQIVVTAGDMKAKGQYKCVFDMTKSAGTGAIVITLRVGTGSGAVGDAAIQTYTFGAGTSVADFGLFEVIATWRTVGSGTSAVIQGMCRGTHQLATTGLFNNAAGWMVLGSPSPSSGFNSNTATVIGLSFNGSTAFAGTTQVVQAQLQQ